MKKTNETIKRIEIITVICLLLVGALTFFSVPGITGHVSSKINSQPVDFLVDQSRLFELTTNSDDSFYITSFRISGKVIGDGIAEIYLDNGLGQQLLVFRNIEESFERGGMGLITGNYVGAEQEFEEEKPEKTIIINSAEFLEIKPNLNFDREKYSSFNGGFDSACEQSCFIEMEMNRNTGYNLVFKIEEGTAIHLTKIQFTMKE